LTSISIFNIGFFWSNILGFTHFSYWCSKERLLIVDLQGVRTSNGYNLTDPAIHSTETLGGGYGELDLGTVGIEAFFSTHKCEKACRGLPKPAKARYTYLDCEDIIRRKKRSECEFMFFFFSQISIINITMMINYILLSSMVPEWHNILRLLSCLNVFSCCVCTYAYFLFA
jgi:hypothetical protein